MNHTETQLPGLTATLTTHAEGSGGLLLARLTADDLRTEAPRAPLQVALVLDRSGSMSGKKLEITKMAVARFVRSLSPDDRVAIVTYDDHIDLVSGLVAGNEALARRVEKIEAGGSTDLYGGWVTGAKVVGRGGRVILLSDGQANAGRFTDGISLGRHAAISYEKYGVTTTTIGVGQDYDEGLMSGMARLGGGAHYFAHTASAVEDAFDQERYSAGSVALERLTLKYGETTLQLGHFWGGETKHRVLVLPSLAGVEMTVRYTNRADGERATHALRVPSEFGYSDDVRLEFLLQRASEAEGEMLAVRDPRSAGEMREKLRSIVLELLAHPTSDEPAVAAVVQRLNASIERLQLLERNYVEEDAMMHRKRSMQFSHNLRERAQAFSSFEDERDAVIQSARSTAPSAMAPQELKVDTSAFVKVPRERWIEWEAIPTGRMGSVLIVAMEDPRKGFIISEIERETGRPVKSVFAGVTSAQIVEMLRAAQI